MRFISKKDCKFPERKKDSHKGEAGRLLIIGGSEEFVGAPILSALAAFKSGVDLVTIVAPKKVAWAINTYNPSIITHKLNSKSFSMKNAPPILRLARGADAVLIGNGMGRKKDQRLLVRKLLLSMDKPVVIDADAIHSTTIKEIRSELFIITPHKREYEELTKNNPGDLTKSCSKDRVILKKGRIDSIVAGKVLYNKTGVPEMSVAGTGDILAGLAAGFLAQGTRPKQAAINAAWLCGKAGEKAHKELGNFTAEELAKFLKW